jgi:AmmeMemoRadiSam system protein B
VPIIREPSCIGCYEGDPERLRRQLHGLFTGARGPGLPRLGKPDGRLHAALIPHIDYQRGGHSFAWGFKEVFERTDASLFVIIGTSHYSTDRFILTRQHFRTPLGTVPTDSEFIDRLVRHYGGGLFDDERAHLPEHSIELEVVFLQYLYENHRTIRIVPLLVGSFHDCVVSGSPPARLHDVGRMVHALRQSAAETREPICWIISGDLAHIGPKFGDTRPVHAAQLDHCLNRDRALLARAEAVDPDGYFQEIVEEMDSRRICGFPPTYTALAALQPKQGKLLHYDRFVEPRGFESVSFASVGFYF